MRNASWRIAASSSFFIKLILSVRQAEEGGGEVMNSISEAWQAHDLQKNAITESD